MSSIDFELAAQRRMTEEFIRRDPTAIVLTPRVPQITPGGGREWIDGTPRPAQTFKLIPQSSFDGVSVGTATGVAAGSNAQGRKYEYVLLGTFDAVAEIKDWFQAPDGQRYEIVGKMPYNGYETKFGLVSYGSNPKEG